MKYVIVAAVTLALAWLAAVVFGIPALMRVAGQHL